MSTLTEFLLARIAEDEAVVNAEPRWLDPGSELQTQFGDFGDSERFLVEIGAARVLAECEAKRQIVGWCSETIGPRDLATYGQHGALADDPDALAVTLAVETLRALALPYADHEHFDPAWRDTPET